MAGLYGKSKSKSKYDCITNRVQRLRFTVDDRWREFGIRLDVDEVANESINYGDMNILQNNNGEI